MYDAIFVIIIKAKLIYGQRKVPAEAAKHA